MLITFTLATAPLRAGSDAADGVAPVTVSVTERPAAAADASSRALREALRSAGWLPTGTADEQVSAARADQLRSLSGFDVAHELGGSERGDVVPLLDAGSGCSGVLLPGSRRSGVLLQGRNESALRESADKLLDVLGTASASMPTDLTQWTDSGRPVARARVQRLNAGRRAIQAATHGAPLVLWIITLALAVVSVLIAAAVGENSTQGWLADWSHATLDRVFTGALGAALVASVMAAQARHRTTTLTTVYTTEKSPR